MTKQDFIKKFKVLCKENFVQDICMENWDTAIELNYTNTFHSDSTVEKGTISMIGFDHYNNFYIEFCDTDYTAYEEDLDNNSDEAWDLLWRLFNEFMEFDDFEASDFKVGDAVYWNDPAIKEYPQDERVDALARRFVIFKIEGDIISISDTYTEAEVYADELVLIS